MTPKEQIGIAILKILPHAAVQDIQALEALVASEVAKANKCPGCGASTSYCGECTRLWQT